MGGKSAIAFVMITVIIDAMGIGLMMPVMPDLLQELGAGTIANAALWGGLLSMIFALMQFLFGPLLGAISDRFGRRPVLLLSLLVVAIDYLLLAVAHTIWLVLLARIIAGIASATQSTASAYMADISSPETKAANFGLVGAAFGIGFVLGPLLGGVLSDFGTRAPFIAAAILATCNLTLGYFAFPETVTDAIRRSFELRRANPFGAFLHLSKLPNITRFLTVILIYHIAFMIYPAIWSFFTKEVYGWNGFEIGISLAVFGILIAFTQGYLIRVFLARWGEYRTALAGLIFNAVGFFLLAFANAGWQAYMIISLSTIGAVTMPSLQGMMSKTVAKNAQGELQGIVMSTTSIGSIISPPLMAYIFNVFTTEKWGLYFPGSPFILASLLTGFSILLILSARKTLP